MLGPAGVEAVQVAEFHSSPIEWITVSATTSVCWLSRPWRWARIDVGCGNGEGRVRRNLRHTYSVSSRISQHLFHLFVQLRERAASAVGVAKWHAIDSTGRKNYDIISRLEGLNFSISALNSFSPEIALNSPRERGLGRLIWPARSRTGKFRRGES
jgi:hypothetical protein